MPGPKRVLPMGVSHSLENLLGRYQPPCFTNKPREGMVLAKDHTAKREGS